MITLGIDTSNYATSVALYDGERNEVLEAKKVFLPVKDGELGLRQNDAVFEHIKTLPTILEDISKNEAFRKIGAVGVSTKPRPIEESYMPCFLTGKMAASLIALQAQKPLIQTTHQEGHIAAALFGAEQLSLWSEDFFVFHVSGGTTDLLLVHGMKQIKQIGTSTDLYAGQAIDRLGKLLGFPFPSGVFVSQSAQACTASIALKEKKPVLNVSFSGIENQFTKKYQDGVLAEEICKFTLLSIAENLNAMAKAARKEYGTLPIIAAGGVMGSEIIAAYLTEKHENISFVSEKLSSDNAIGVAILAAKRE